MIIINNLVANSIVITTGNPELKTPLYFEENEPGASVAMLCQNDMLDEFPLKCHLQYSTDKMATWATWDGSVVYLDNCMDSRVYFRADPENPNIDGFHKQGKTIRDESWTHHFKTDKSVKAGGNIQFLLESTGTRTDVPEYGFQSLFGYNGDCSSLTTAPALPATALAQSCYTSMFRNCSKLASMDVSFTAWDPTSATTNWVNGVGASGTFTCPSTLPQTPGIHNIPSGWTIVEK